MTRKASHIDLHLHSNCSDGVLPPAELVARAAREGLGTIAIADHDSVSGIAAGLAAAADHHVELIPAVELSTRFHDWTDVHVLGYGIEYRERSFNEKLTRFRERREHRNVEILERVNEVLAGEGRSPVASAEVLIHAKDAIGRPHIARALLERGYVENVEEAFRRYLVPCNVPKYCWPIAEAIEEIKGIEGVAVLAHPTTLTTDHGQLRKAIIELRELGLDGIEVYNNLAYPETMEFLRRLANECGMIITAGSDFHGIEEGLEMGRGRGGIRFSDTLLPPLKRLMARRAGRI